MEQKFVEAKNKLKLLGPTSRLWVQYIEMMDILKSNIRSDRIGLSYVHNPMYVPIFILFFFR